MRILALALALDAVQTMLMAALLIGRCRRRTFADRYVDRLKSEDGRRQIHLHLVE